MEKGKILNVYIKNTRWQNFCTITGSMRLSISTTNQLNIDMVHSFSYKFFKSNESESVLSYSAVRRHTSASSKEEKVVGVLDSFEPKIKWMLYTLATFSKQAISFHWINNDELRSQWVIFIVVWLHELKIIKLVKWAASLV